MKINTDNKLFYSYTALGTLLAVGLLLLGIFIRSGFDDFAHRDRIISVRGLCEREIPANKVTWPIVSKILGNDLPSLYQQVQSTNQTVINFLKTNGVSDKEISVNAPAVTDLQADQYNSNTNKLYRYSVTNVIVVTSTNVEKVRNLIKNQTQLMDSGIAIVAGDYNYPIVYEYTGLNSIKPDMIAEATKNARQAAMKFAEDSDSKLGKIKHASQGQFSIDDRDQYTAYIKKVRVVSSIDYYLKD